MDDQSKKIAVEKVRIALEMYGLGESLMRQKLRRQYPSASDADIEARLADWLSHHPGAEVADSPGKLRRSGHE